jgi:hypothetical protein
MGSRFGLILPIETTSVTPPATAKVVSSDVSSNVNNNADIMEYATTARTVSSHVLSNGNTSAASMEYAACTKYSVPMVDRRHQDKSMQHGAVDAVVSKHDMDVDRKENGVPTPDPTPVIKRKVQMNQEQQLALQSSMALDVSSICPVLIVEDNL